MENNTENSKWGGSRKGSGKKKGTYTKDYERMTFLANKELAERFKAKHAWGQKTEVMNKLLKMYLDGEIDVK